MGNSSYINGDVEIMYDDSELRQTNHHVNPLFYLFVFLLSHSLEEVGWGRQRTGGGAASDISMWET
jgi:hypothetical protein